MRRLLIRPGAIGDCILSFPALDYCRADYTEVWIPSAVAPLVRFADLVCSLVGTGIELLGIPDRQAPEALRQRLASFDSIVSWYGSKRPDFREALCELNPHCVFHQALPPDNATVHAVDFFCDQVGAPRGLQPRIDLPRAAPRHSVVMQPFSGSRKKNWPLARYRELASRFTCNVEWTAGESEALDEAVRFAELDQLAAWLTGAELYIGNDSGITHLSAALGIPTLVLFGPTDAGVWAPRGEDVQVLHGVDLNALTVNEVWSAVNQ